MSTGFAEFVDGQVKASDRLREGILAAVYDGDVPMVDVEDGLEDATVEIKGYDRVAKVVAVRVRAKWSGYFQADEDHEMTESGHVDVDARFKHQGQQLEYAGASYDVHYDNCFTAHEDE